MISVLFRADASPTLGIGHVMRCLTLADALTAAGARCRFAVTAETITSVTALGAAPHDLQILSRWDDPAELTATDAVDWVVVDHYRLGQGYERALRPWAGRVMAIDDLADRRHDCDLLLDQTVGQGSERYADLAPPGARILAGAHHALLRPGFTTGAATPDKPRLLVSLGGSDPANATAIALDAVAHSGLDLPVTVVMGSAAPYLDHIRAKVAALPNAELRIDETDMAKLMAQCTVAVGAAGTSALERCAMGLPTVLVVIADNQRFVAEGLTKAGAALAVELDTAAIATALSDLAHDAPARKAMAERARALCDGGGAARLADLMMALASPDLAVRSAVPEDGQDLLDWRNDPLTRANSLTTGEVARDDHFVWLNRVLADGDQVLLIGEHYGAKAGMVRFDHLGDGQWRVSIAVAPMARGHGRGRILLAAAIARLARTRSPARLLAEVKQTNAASCKLFEACGFHHGETRDGVCHYRLDLAIS